MCVCLAVEAKKLLGGQGNSTWLEKLGCVLDFGHTTVATHESVGHKPFSTFLLCFVASSRKKRSVSVDRRMHGWMDENLIDAVGSTWLGLIGS